MYTSQAVLSKCGGRGGVLLGDLWRNSYSPG